jgi:hypothetical protein
MRVIQGALPLTKGTRLVVVAAAVLGGASLISFSVQDQEEYLLLNSKR